ncbi:histone-lysine N-methyltransferase SETMAR-like [Papilio machaon]|uniref:histone-lysine N-methyltransferase SETMAR-like n=1 Tax=Papilio machaon TaxID=76193 RepID=UPI001E665C4B|nr:histone-lysine N-methyltransferase SETMAR-like [Papilio machaon]
MLLLLASTTLVDNDELKAIVEADDIQSMAEFAAALNVSVKTKLVHLRQIGKIKKLDKWVPHELNDRQCKVRVKTCLALINRHTNEAILNRIVTCNEKLILFDNCKLSASWLDPGSAPKQCPKRKHTPRKVMVTVWWSSAGVLHHRFLPNGVSITTYVDYEELNTMMEKLAHLQPALVNHSSSLLLHVNARPHAAQQTVSKLQELGLEAVRHPPYSPDLVPTDYYFFQNLDNFLAGKKFNTREAVQNAF